MTAVSPKILNEEFCREENRQEGAAVRAIVNKSSGGNSLNTITRDEFCQTDKYIEELEKQVKNARRILYVNRAQQLVIMSQRLLIRDYKKGLSSYTDAKYNQIKFTHYNHNHGQITS